MAKFQVLTGSKLNNAINGFGKTVSTFSEREHQLAYSALNHVELHNDPKYLNALFAVTPVNYRKGLVAWSTAFGKVTFNKETRAFEYAKGKASKMDDAMEIAPANYEKQAGDGKAKENSFNEVKYLEKVIAKLEEEKADPRVLQAVKGALTLARTPAAPAAPAAAKPAKPAKPATPAVAPAHDPVNVEIAA